MSAGPFTERTDGDPTPPGPPPAKVFLLVHFSGRPRVAESMDFSPFVLSGQITVLAKNDGRPDPRNPATPGASF